MRQRRIGEARLVVADPHRVAQLVGTPGTGRARHSRRGGRAHRRQRVRGHVVRVELRHRSMPATPPPRVIEALTTARRLSFQADSIAPCSEAENSSSATSTVAAATSANCASACVRLGQRRYHIRPAFSHALPPSAVAAR